MNHIFKVLASRSLKDFVVADRLIPGNQDLKSVSITPVDQMLMMKTETARFRNDVQNKTVAWEGTSQGKYGKVMLSEIAS